MARIEKWKRRKAREGGKKGGTILERREVELEGVKSGGKKENLRKKGKGEGAQDGGIN